MAAAARMLPPWQRSGGVGASVTGGEDILAEVGHLERSIQRHDGATGSLLRNRRGGGIHGTVDAWFEA